MSVTIGSTTAPVAHGSAAKAALLRILRTSTAPMSARALAAAADIPLTTLRFHLDGLVASGQVEARSDPSGGRGRPRLLYAPVPAGAVADGYRWLSALLAGSLLDGSSAPAAERAERAGQRWAEAHAQPAAPGASFAEGLDAVAGVFADFGFEPELRAADVPGPAAAAAPASAPASGERPVELLLHACPFADVARASAEAVCSIHAGLLKGLLARSGARTAAARLQPFAEPGLCVAVIEPGTAGAAEAVR